MATSTSVFQITPFENCDECIRKVKRAVRKIGLKLIGMDPEKGILVISSTIDQRREPEAIRAALEEKFQNESIIWLPNNHSSGVNVNREAGSSVNFRDMTGMLMMLPEAGRVQRVEYRQDVLRVDYYEKPSMISNVAAAADVSDFVPMPVPPTSTNPSAPPMTTPYNGYPVSGWPYADHYTTPQKDDYPDCACTIM